jgi:DNA polymerase-3 subunit epsilon
MDKENQAFTDIFGTLDGRNYVVLDTETTGLDSPEVVSVAVVDSHGKTLLNEFVRPAKPIEPGASRITGITNEAVKDRPEFPTIYESLKGAISGRLVVIYNASYDLKVLCNTCRRYNLEMPLVEQWCAMEWFAKVYGKWDSNRKNYTWQKLSTAAGYFAVEQNNAHDALGDCITTLRVIEAGLDRARKLQPHMDRLL